MKRWHDDRSVTLRQARQWWARQAELGASPPHEAGRFRKRHALGCGRARCQLCHGDKFPRRVLTRHEVEAERSLREQVAEVSG